MMFGAHSQKVSDTNIKYKKRPSGEHSSEGLFKVIFVFYGGVSRQSWSASVDEY